MTMDGVIFAGLEISSGRKPITLAGLNDGLDVVLLEQWGISEVIDSLKEYESVQIAINVPSSKSGRELYKDFQNRVIHDGLKPNLRENSTRPWIESKADECYRVFQAGLLPRRTLEGRLQRALILYEEGLQIHDPMDFFEEITRHKLLQGMLPVENIYTLKQLDALVMAYVSWLAGNSSGKVLIRGEWTLPAPG